jgi:hypothetical protein
MNDGARGTTWQLPRGLDLAKVRHPRERRVLALSLLANAVLIAGAVAIVYLAPEWLSAHGRVSSLVNRLRLAAAVSIIVLPVLGVLRLGRWAAFRENAVRLDRDQVPEIFAILERHCRTLGVAPPELYATTLETVPLSTALALSKGRRVIALGRAMFEGLERIEDRADVFDFVLAQELGRLALGHASWWADLVLGYLKRIPVLRLPLLTVQAESRDRFAATLSPDGIRGLVILVVGGDLLDHVDAATFLHQVLHDDTPARWSWVGRLGREGPHLADRIRELCRAGFLHLPLDAAGVGEALSAGHAPAEGADGGGGHPPTSH